MKIYLIVCLVYTILNASVVLYDYKKENKDLNWFELLCLVFSSVIMQVAAVVYFYDLVLRKIKEVKRRKLRES